MVLSDDSFPFGVSLPFFGGFSRFRRCIPLNMAGQPTPSQRTLQKQGKPMDKAWSSLAGGFNYPFIFHLFLGFHDPIWRLAYVFQRWVETQPPPSLKFLGTSSLSEASTLMMELQDLSLSLVLGQKTGEKETPTKREKGKSLKLTVTCFFFKNCGDTCFFWCKSGSHFLEGIKTILTTDDYFEWFLSPKFV